MLLFPQQVAGLTMIHEAYAQSRQQRVIDEYFRLYPGDRECEFFLGGQGLVSAGFIVVRSRGRCRVFVAGIISDVMARRIAEGYAARLRVAPLAGFNAAFATDALSLMQLVIRNVIRPGDVLELHGHSAGGCVCEAIAKQAALEFPDRLITIDTYGAPAPAERGATIAGPNFTRGRWMNIDDPVPLVPWANISGGRHLALWLWSQLFPGPSGGGPHPEVYVQPGPGIRIRTGHYGAGQNPLFTVDPARQMQAWLDRLPDPLDQHDAGTYLIVMRSLAARFPEPAPEPEPVVEPVPPRQQMETVVMPFPLAYGPERNLVLPIVIRPDSIALDVVGTPLGTIILENEPMAFGKINPRKAFRKVKVGTRWHVELNGVLVIQCPEGKTPGTIVRRLNGMLRAIGNNNFLIMPDFIDQLQAWIMAASTDDTYCRPPITLAS